MALKENSPSKHPKSPPGNEHTSPKKRRKVNHACIYCRRSHMTCDLERPCARCIKRSIGHLCHDEPREALKGKSEQDPSSPKNDSTSENAPCVQGLMGPPTGTSSTDQSLYESAAAKVPLGADQKALSRVLSPSTQQHSNETTNTQAFNDADQQFLSYGNWGYGNQNNDQDVNGLYTPYMFNAHDIGSEFDVLSNFLNNSLLDESALMSNDETNFPLSDEPTSTQQIDEDDAMRTSLARSASVDPTNQPHPYRGGSISRPKSVKPSDKDEERFYLNIADPSGNDKPEERMRKLLEAKYNAGLLRPFNYVQGYARLNAYLEGHMRPNLRQRMMRHIDRFRPKFREKMQSLTGMELTMVEMWFERSLMEYDRVFASMAIPACCWRRTGEIFRGNKAMAELIHVPVDKLRDGQLALQEIMAENDLVNYWDNFLAIAFDNSQKAMLTTCNLKSQDLQSAPSEFKCCFSFTVRRDAQHNIPSLIVGNFLPQIERKT